jgi:ergothioneine biosynthesis protein EgtB
MSLTEKYTKIRLDSIAMCKPLRTEDFIPQPIYYVSPPKWNLGHTTWFFEEMILKKHFKHYQEFHPRYGLLFNSYYNTMGERIQRDQRGSLSRPSVEEVLLYRKYVDEHMHHLLEKTLSEELQYLVILGINHEQQHQELFFTDLKYTFGLNPLYPAYSNIAYCEDRDEATVEYIAIPKGTYQVGYAGSGFCFDNEMRRHTVYLQPYSVRNTLVTNGEYAQFVEDSGYEKFEYWHDEALYWLRENQIKYPMYWHKKGNKWFQYTLAGLREIQPEHILTHITFYEASAFAQWKGERLPTEFEWEVAADKLDWGRRWEWTESAYLPYPGYHKAEGAVGEYNGKFMINQKVLRGGSIVTPKGHSRKSYRNFFHPQMGWQFNGIRLAK